MEAIPIRRAVATDAARLSELAARTFSETFAAQNRPEDMAKYLAETFSPQLQAAEIADPSGEVLVAEVQGALVGYAQLGFGPAPSCVPGADAVELKRLYVEKLWHGRGPSSLLMEAVLERSRSRGAQTLWLGVWEHNERAKAYYAKKGFTRVGEHVFMLGDDAKTDWVMARPL